MAPEYMWFWNSLSRSSSALPQRQIGGAVTTQKIGNWYATLVKPSWNPPDWVFGPVWSILYFCMAVAAWLIWRQGGFAGAKLPLILFGVQLALNVLWSCLFFGLRSPGLACP